MKFWNQPLFQTRDLNFFRKDDGTGKVVECLAEGEKRERRGGERTLRTSRVRGQDFPRRLTTGQGGEKAKVGANGNTENNRGVSHSPCPRPPLG